MTMDRHEEQALTQQDRVPQKPEGQQVSLEDFASRQELEAAARAAATNAKPEQLARMREFDGPNKLSIYQKNADGTEATIASGGQADPEVQARAFIAINNAIQDGVSHQVAGDNVVANLFNKTPENTAAVREAQGQAILAASMNQGFSDTANEADQVRANQQVRNVAVG